jgi:hypothetical protein
MGIIRGTIIFTLTILLFISLFAVNIFLTLSYSISYSSIHPYLINTTSEFAQSSGASATAIQELAQKNMECSNSTPLVNFTFENNDISVPCTVINSGAKTTIDYLINATANELYYKNYSCNFIECIKSENSVILSKAAEDYWNSKLIAMIFVSLAIFALIFLFSKEKHNAFIIAGITAILSSLPFRQIEWIISGISEFLPFRVLPVFFSQAPAASDLMFAAGIILVVAGIIFGFLRAGIKIGSFIESIFEKIRKDKRGSPEENVTKEEVEELVKKEVKEEIKKEADKETVLNQKANKSVGQGKNEAKNNKANKDKKQ